MARQPIPLYPPLCLSLADIPVVEAALEDCFAGLARPAAGNGAIR